MPKCFAVLGWVSVAGVWWPVSSSVTPAPPLRSAPRQEETRNAEITLHPSPAGDICIRRAHKSAGGTSKTDLYVGYDYLRLNSGGTAFNFNGGSGQLAYNVNPWFGVVGDFGGYYTGTGFSAGILSYLFGRRINFRHHGRFTPFAHALFGGGRTIVDSPQNAFAITTIQAADSTAP
jgi:hypothetical protein